MGRVHVEVSVAIIVRNEAPFIRDLIKGLKDQSYNDFEVVIFDNGSFDGTYEICLEESDQRFRIFSSPSENRLGHLRNESLARCKGRFVFFTDGDCVPSRYWLEEGLKVLRTGIYDGVEGRTFYRYQGVVTVSDYNTQNLDSGEFMTCNIAYSREALERVGGFDSEFCYGHEDQDLAIRIGISNNIKYCEQMLVCHQTKRFTPATMIKRTLRIYDTVRLIKKYGDHPRMIKRILYPEHILLMIFPIFMLTHYAYRTPNDVVVGLAKYFSLFVERIIIWRAAVKFRVFVL